MMSVFKVLIKKGKLFDTSSTERLVVLSIHIMKL